MTPQTGRTGDAGTEARRQSCHPQHTQVHQRVDYSDMSVCRSYSMKREKAWSAPHQCMRQMNGDVRATRVRRPVTRTTFFRHGDNRDEPTPHTTGRSIRYEVTAAPTTLIASLDERTLFLPGWPLEAE